MSNKWTVYKITSPNGRVYIGCTSTDLETRFQKGRGYHTNKEMFDDIIFYGWQSFTTEIIYQSDFEDAAREREHLEIQKYPDGYNRYRGIKGYVSTGTPKTQSKAVLCVETGIVYESIYQAALQTGLSKNKISYCCRGIRNRTGGYHWKFV